MRGVSVVCVAAGLLWAGCAPSGRSLEEAIAAYADAVQHEDLDSLYCLSAGASDRPAFESWARAHIEAYLDGRDAGRVELSDNPVRLVKLFALGRGTFYQVGSVREVGGGVAVKTSLRFGYAHQDLSRFSPGTTVYMSAASPGRVLSFRVPAGPGELTLTVLETIDVEWILARAPKTEDCDTGWAVVSTRPVDGTERTNEITWIY